MASPVSPGTGPPELIVPRRESRVLILPLLFCWFDGEACHSSDAAFRKIDGPGGTAPRVAIRWPSTSHFHCRLAAPVARGILQPTLIRWIVEDSTVCFSNVDLSAHTEFPWHRIRARTDRLATANPVLLRHRLPLILFRVWSQHQRFPSCVHGFPCSGFCDRSRVGRTANVLLIHRFFRWQKSLDVD